MTRCTGHCCQAFLVDEGASLDAIKAEAQKSRDPDDLRIAEMLVPLGLFRRNPRQPLITEADTPEPWTWYTCRHHDAETGDCLVYEDRPSMCRNFGEACNFVNCARTLRG